VFQFDCLYYTSIISIKRLLVTDVPIMSSFTLASSFSTLYLFIYHDVYFHILKITNNEINLVIYQPKLQNKRRRKKLNRLKYVWFLMKWLILKQLWPNICHFGFTWLLFFLADFIIILPTTEIYFLVVQILL
jgi:hypothetical protein